MPTPEPRRRHFEGARVTSRSARSSTPAAARTGRANFDPYWKLSAMSPRTMAWQEAKGTHWTADAARDAAPGLFPAGTTVRLIRVFPGGREVVGTFTI